jgi:glucan phosphoethanolaminetransferase (alkaline phosphatase superfamily)
MVRNAVYVNGVQTFFITNNTSTTGVTCIPSTYNRNYNDDCRTYSDFNKKKKSKQEITKNEQQTLKKNVLGPKQSRWR